MRLTTISVDGRKIQVGEGANLLGACLENGIYVPHLCWLEELRPAAASCRLCFVEIEGRGGPEPACTVAAEPEMVVRTETAAVRRLQRTGLRLLLSVHHIACKGCPANRRCDLQRIAKFLKVGLHPGGLETTLRQPEVEALHPGLDFYPNRCVLCGKCVHACRGRDPEVVLTFARRGFETRIAAYGAGAGAPAACVACRACADICPVAALQLHPSRCGGTVRRPQ
jgi:predicted molibdopterin-dependent oxidoreductase YjgC